MPMVTLTPEPSDSVGGDVRRADFLTDGHNRPSAREIPEVRVARLAERG
ncbi:MAG: hypothetical protein RLZZ282_821 [Verrucomicrobiota bacterium]